MPAYLIANIDITDAAAFEEYRTRVPVVVEQFGGKYLIRGSQPSVREGELFFTRLTVLEFPSMDALHTFYDSAEYAPLLAIRVASTRSDVVFMPGFQ